MLTRITIGTRLLMMVAVAVTGCVVIALMGVSDLRRSLYDDRYERTQEHVETASTLVAYFHDLAQTGAMPEAEAQALALSTLAAQRYADEDYYFVIDHDGVIVMHGVNPSLNGRDMLETRDPNGVPLFVDMIEVAEEDGAGFVEYMWPKAGATEPQPKISYVAAFNPWGWIIGTGIYVDDVSVVFWQEVLWISAIGGLIVLGIASIALAIARSINRPLHDLTASMDRLANDDVNFSVNFTEQSNEIGALARALVTFRNNAVEMKRLKTEQAQHEEEVAKQRQAELATLAGNFEGSVMGIVEEVSSAANQLTSTARSMTDIASTTRERAETVAQGSEQASSNVQTVAAAAEELAGSISEISHQINQSSTVTRRAADEAGTANTQVQGLATAVSKIGEIVQLINSIAEQTNLLALNATIEAARAGDAGKGFAVVASEVKTLANQTAKATEEISTQIAGVQSATGESVAAIDRINGIVGQINETSATIAAAVEEQGAATQEITRNVHSTAEATALVSNSIGDVHDSAMDTGRNAQDVLQASTNLAEGAQRLQAELSSFLQTIRAA